MSKPTILYGKVFGQQVSLWSYHGEHEFPIYSQLCEFPLHEYPHGVISVARSPGSKTVQISHHAQNGTMEVLYRGLIREPFTGLDRRAVPVLRELARRDAPTRTQKKIAGDVAAFLRAEQFREGIAA